MTIFAWGWRYKFSSLEKTNLGSPEKTTIYQRENTKRHGDFYTMNSKKKTLIPDNVLTWLLDDKSPSVKYRTLTDSLGLSEDHPDVRAAKARVPASKTAQKILAQIQDDGSWPWIAGYDSPELGFNYLGELGLDSSHPRVAKAVDVFLSQQCDDGSFPNSYRLSKGGDASKGNDESCYYALTFRGLIKLGYRDDPRVKKALEFTLSEARWDGGYLCTKSYVKDTTKSCIRGSKNVLLLFSECPTLWDTSQCRALVDYFLERKVFYKRTDHTQFVRGHPQTYFPFHYRFGVLEPLYALSKMGYGQHPALTDAWAFLEEKRTAEGKYILDWTIPKCAFNPGKRGHPNKWVTLYAYLALKHKNEQV